ncbi:MAG: tRNA (N6-isopentenyl adenosine(37)-C2)-methylthiotransferase MiaB, partial [Thermoanaerobaculia bacterium]
MRPSAAKKFWIETWGCQMNELDTQRMAGQLMQSGMLPTRDVEDADVILLNSCSVRENAENKVFSQLGRYRRFKSDNPDLAIGLCGCVAQQVGETALDRNPDLDFVLGPARVGELAQILDRRRSGERVVATGFPEERHFDIDTISRAGTYKGMVTVIEGCDKNCTFCIVPLTRGPERCRPLEEIVIEVEHLVDYGFLEIELLGQTVNHWRQPGGQWDFADLLDRVARIHGVERLRFVTSYPRDFTPRMVEQFARHANICPYLHLPVQSGSDRVLKRMGRGYTVGEFGDLVERLRKARPALALSTDLIVGFPGETEADFQDTVALVEDVGFASIFAFKYSPRPGTAAVHLPDPIDDGTASRRLQELLQLQVRIQRNLNEQLVGSEMEVLVTGWSEAPQLQSGRTACHRIVHFPAEPTAQPLG